MQVFTVLYWVILYVSVSILTVVIKKKIARHIYIYTKSPLNQKMVCSRERGFQLLVLVGDCGVILEALGVLPIKQCM